MKYFLHSCLFCGVQLTAMWARDQREGVRLAEKYKTWLAVLCFQNRDKESIGTESTVGAKTRTVWVKDGNELVQFA
jgi:hypothetical protein